MADKTPTGLHSTSLVHDERTAPLPNQLTSFVGRERELTEVKRLLASTRLLTLTGTGGCGKTRLALQVATELAANYPGGIGLVEFAALTDPALIAQTVAATLGLRPVSDQPILTTLISALRSKRLLLVGHAAIAWRSDDELFTAEPFTPTAQNAS